MAKRLVIALILFSMVLHSASRLGVLSYLYEQRHQIAYTLGMIAEIPIAMCGSDYNFATGLHIQAQEEADSTLPRALFTTHEICLFFNGLAQVSINPNRPVSPVDKQSVVIDRAYIPPALSIFHPPC